MTRTELLDYLAVPRTIPQIGKHFDRSRHTVRNMLGKLDKLGIVERVGEVKTRRGGYPKNLWARTGKPLVAPKVEAPRPVPAVNGIVPSAKRNRTALELAWQVVA